MDEKSATGLGADSPFEEDVAKVIRSFGFEADPQVGTKGFRLDIGVRHPDRPAHYILAVECDGAAYHSALWARERDRCVRRFWSRSAGASTASGAPTGFTGATGRLHGCATH